MKSKTCSFRRKWIRGVYSQTPSGDVEVIPLIRIAQVRRNSQRISAVYVLIVEQNRSRPGWAVHLVFRHSFMVGLPSAQASKADFH